MTAAAGATVVLAFLVGVSLGLLGGGGSVLSVPLLVYVAGWEPQQAATGSLVVVGITSGLALRRHARAGRVRWRTGLIFGTAGMAGAYLGGRLAVLVPGAVLLIAFAALMLAAATGMIRGRRAGTVSRGEVRLLPALVLGAAVGTATGFVGAGGGFAVVPALVLVAGLPMPAAVGTSLLVIAMQSAAGLAGHLAGSSPPWGLTMAVTACAVAGSVAGARLTGRIPADALRRGFGFLVLAVAGLVLAQEAPATVARGAAPVPLVTAAVLAALAVLAVTVARGRRRRRGSTTSLSSDPGHTWPTPKVSDPLLPATGQLRSGD